MKRPLSLALLATAAATPAAAAGTASLAITVTGLRSEKGVVRIVVCPEHAAFPDCANPTASIAAPITGTTARAEIPDLAPGTYAISLFHDENGNGKLDTLMGIPREGYGFSRNPPFRPRAARFSEAAIEVAGHTTTEVRLRYLF